MENPIGQYFDTRDLIEYKEHLDEEMLQMWIDNFEGTDLSEEVEDHDIDDVDFNLESFRERFEEEIIDYLEFMDFYEELSASSDFQYGEVAIREDYFEEYCEEMCKDIGYLSKDLPGFIENSIDWEKVADQMAMDYMIVSYEDNDYYIRH